jgi:tripartite-type tricarboxylate transporter receptor subunit TctC
MRRRKMLDIEGLMATRRELLVLGLAAAPTLALTRSRALAQGRFPERPIRLVVPFPPGGVYDALGRPWADKMKPLLGTVVVENVGGAGGGLGGAAVARARPDGYTLLLGGLAINVINAVAVSRPLYERKDLESVSLLGSTCFAISTNPAVPVATLKELIDYARANPGRLSYGSAGTGSLNHLTGEIFKAQTGTSDIAHVPYRGAGPALTDLISGQIPMAVVSVSAQVIDLHRTGKLRMLAVTTPKRLAAAAEIPTAVEGGLPDLVAEQFIGLFAPTGTPRAIVEQIAQATASAQADPDFQQRLGTLGFQASGDSSPGKLRSVVEAEFAYWTPVIKATGLKLD